MAEWSNNGDPDDCTAILRLDPVHLLEPVKCNPNHWFVLKGEGEPAIVKLLEAVAGDRGSIGVRIELCGATAKAHHWGNADLLPNIKVNTDAMARTTQLVQEGFVTGAIAESSVIASARPEVNVRRE